MREIFFKYKRVLFRTFGAGMLIVGFITYFWAMPKEVLSENEAAAANVARMEAMVAGSSSSSKVNVKPDSSKFVEELKNTQQTQMTYAIILLMVLGVIFLVYSFIDKSKE